MKQRKYSTEAERLADQLPDLLISLMMNKQQMDLVGKVVGELLDMQRKVDKLTNENVSLREAVRMVGGKWKEKKR